MTKPPVAREPWDPDNRKWGRPLVQPPGGGKPKPYTRCTSYVKVLDDQTALTEWKLRMAALGFSQRPDLSLAFSSIAPDLRHPDPGPEHKRKANALCEAALEAGGASAAATTGTALHLLAQHVDEGVDVGEVPPEARRDLDAYQRVTAPLKALHIEEFMVNDDLRVGGTPDRIVEYQGRRYIADLKTGKVAWSGLSIAMQLAVYAHSRLYDTETHERVDVPGLDLDRAIVIHLPAGSGQARLLWADIDAGWDAVQVATEVRQWRNRGSARGARALLKPLEHQEALFSPAPEPEAAPPLVAVAPANPDLRNAVASAPTEDALTALWREHKHEWSQDLTDLAVARRALLRDAG